MKIRIFPRWVTWQIALALPDLPRDKLYWRFHFMMGSMFYTMADPGRIRSVNRNNCRICRQLPFLGQGQQVLSRQKAINIGQRLRKV